MKNPKKKPTSLERTPKGLVFFWFLYKPCCAYDIKLQARSKNIPNHLVMFLYSSFLLKGCSKISSFKPKRSESFYKRNQNKNDDLQQKTTTVTPLVRSLRRSFKSLANPEIASSRVVSIPAMQQITWQGPVERRFWSKSVSENQMAFVGFVDFFFGENYRFLTRIPSPSQSVFITIV